MRPMETRTLKPLVDVCREFGPFTVREFEAAQLRVILDHFEWNRTRTARKLKITRDQLSTRMSRLGIVDEKRQKATVYFVLNKATNLIKIGLASDVKNRLIAIRVNSGCEIELLATEQGGIDRERALHERFAALLVRGEWFRDDPSLREYIAGLDVH